MPSRSRSRIALLVAILMAATFGAMSRDARAQWIILHGKNGYTERNIPAEAAGALKELTKKGADFKSIGFSPVGGFVILHDKNAVLARNAPKEAVKILAEQQANRVELRSIAFTFAGGWSVLTGIGSQSWDIGPDPFAKLDELPRAGHKVKSIGFTPTGGWIILYDKNKHVEKGIAEDVLDKIGELEKKNADLKSIAFARNGGWAILYNKNSVATNNIPRDLEAALNGLIKKGTPIKSVSFLTGAVLALSDDDEETRKDVLARMNRAGVPGLGIALFNNGKLEWARGYGLLHAKEEAPVTEHTRFHAGAISQSLTALAALRLVEQKKLGLDQPLNEKLASWKVPENDYYRKKPATLRHVLSHSAGFNVSALGIHSDSPPSLLDVLEGKAETPAVTVEAEPGTKAVESVGGYCVAQQLLMDVSGKPFPDLIQELVLDPAGMKESAFAPLPKEWESDAAVGHFVSQQPLPWRISNCAPALAAGGLWTTPGDLARFVIALCEAHQGKPKAILSAALSESMLTRQIEDRGLGVTLSGKGKSLAVVLKGTSTGYVCNVIAYPATGQGAVIMTNSDTGDRLITELVASLKLQYGWPE